MSRLVDRVGHRYGRLLVIDRGPNTPRGKKARWNCICACGNHTVVAGDHLADGLIISCGCMRGVTHGFTGTSEHKAWVAMRARCYNANDSLYHKYGGRGITICERWRENFLNFLSDMGPKPTRKHSIDRIDNDGSYSPENCRWATRSEQARNTRQTRFLTYAGRTMCVKDWAEEMGMHVSTLRYRLFVQRLPVGEALTLPVKPKGPMRKP